MNYEQALRYWYGRINYEQRTLQMSDLKLDRMHALLGRLGDPHGRLRIVHVAGSKGKGSTSAMLAAVLRRAGLRTGLYTSPHLVRVEERFQIDGAAIPEDELAALMTEVAAAAAAVDAGQAEERQRVTFFEIATALGFLHFARRGAEVAVVEVGLGGRFDATNVCTPLVAIITSISLDHTQQLGTTPAAIAREKAGILKPGRPALSGVRDPEAQHVIAEVARERDVPLRTLGTHFDYRYEAGLITPNGDQLPRVRVSTGERTWPTMRLRLFGEHQAANAALTVAAVEELRRQGFTIPDAAVAAGLEQVEWPARLEVVRRRPLVVLDCAHNPASAQALTETLRTSLPPAFAPGGGARRWLVFASSQDKDIAGILRVLAQFFDHAVLTRYGNSPRGAAPQQLAALLERTAEMPYTVCDSAGAAWEWIGARARPEDLVCITGSVFLAGEMRALIG